MKAHTDLPAIEILETWAVPGAPPFSRILGTDVLFESYLSSISLPEHSLHIIVSTFPFLYEVASTTGFLASATDARVEVGEGLEIICHLEDRGGEIFSLSLVGGRHEFSRSMIGRGQAVLFFSRLLSDLDRSLHSIGVDLSECLRKFPPAFF